MSTDRIERDILIEAPVDVVWRVVTEPEHMTKWFSDAAELELRPGADGTITWEPNETRQGNVARISVVAVDPPRAWSYRWLHAEAGEARAGTSTLVELTLEPEGERTRLRIVESGILDMPWTEERTAEFVADHTSGWDVLIVQARDYAAKQVPAAR